MTDSHRLPPAGLPAHRGSMAGLCPPLPTLRRRPYGRQRTARGRCGSLLLHRSGLAPPTPCRSPGALRIRYAQPGSVVSVGVSGSWKTDLQRRNETHASTTDPEAKLSKKGKGKEAKLAYTGNVMTENRNGFVVEAELRQVSGMVERE